MRMQAQELMINWFELDKGINKLTLRFCFNFG